MHGKQKIKMQIYKTIIKKRHEVAGTCRRQKCLIIKHLAVIQAVANNHKYENKTKYFNNRIINLKSLKE